MLKKLTLAFFALVCPQLAYTAEFFCASGNVTCLIAAINEANGTPEENTITLEAGTYALTTVDNNTDGENGLPSITGIVTLKGVGAEPTIIERQGSAPFFRLVHTAATGRLMLEGLTLRGGVAFGATIQGNFGGGVFNWGTLTITNSNLQDNSVRGQGGSGGAIWNSGTLTIAGSTLAANFVNTNRGGSCGGIFNQGTLTITSSTLGDNSATGNSASGGAIDNRLGALTITSSTLAGNSVRGEVNVGRGGSLFNSSGTVTITNSTLAGNSAAGPSGPVNAGGGLFNSIGSVALRNTLLALNTVSGGGPDCFGQVTSLDNNLIGDPTDCTITLLPNDLTGDPGLGDFTDDGTPGRGHFPLRPDSQAIDAGNPDACPELDQLGLPRIGICDIGAVEFQGRLLVSIDIGPRSDANRIDPSSNRQIRVAILTTDVFDATTVDPSTVRFGAAGTEAAPFNFALRDVDEDGDIDMVLRFEIQQTGIKCGDTSASLTGETSDGLSIVGSNPIRTVRCKRAQ